MSYNGSLTLFELQTASQLGVASWALLVGVLKKVARILHDVHERGFGHNDLHANNIVVDDTLNPTIVDFGYARPFGKLMVLELVPLNSALWSQYDPLLSVCGQPTCPENDVYSFGRLVYDVLLRDRRYPLEQWQRLEGLVVKALSPHKENRPTLPEFHDCLRDLEMICLALFTGDSECKG
ncbi:uncharacterized protein [Palaemon carinicauda]|uniref:uncharacterized protein n=1 Tax=Palaemon carinicauda TaxID=392227 RepID=UPI0035B589DF